MPSTHFFQLRGLQNEPGQPHQNPQPQTALPACRAWLQLVRLDSLPPAKTSFPLQVAEGGKAARKPSHHVIHSLPFS